MTYKEMILDSLIQDDEAFTQIVEYFVLDAEINISPLEIKRLLAEMLDEGYIFINYSWKNEHDEHPYSLTEKGRKAWKDINWKSFIDGDFEDPMLSPAVIFHRYGPLWENGQIIYSGTLEECTQDLSGYETVDYFVKQRHRLYFLALKKKRACKTKLLIGEIVIGEGNLQYHFLGRFGKKNAGKQKTITYGPHFERAPAKAQAQIKAVYRNGCIYVKDDQHTVKYDIEKGKLFRRVSNKERDAAFAPRYSAKRSDDGQALYVTKHETEETKVITFETLARTSPALNSIIENLKGRRISLENVERISLPSGDVIYETEQGVYFPLPVRDEWGNTANIIFRYDFEIEQCYYITSEYAGDASLLPYVIDIQA